MKSTILVMLAFVLALSACGKRRNHDHRPHHHEGAHGNGPRLHHGNHGMRHHRRTPDPVPDDECCDPQRPVGMGNMWHVRNRTPRKAGTPIGLIMQSTYWDVPDINSETYSRYDVDGTFNDRDSYVNVNEPFLSWRWDPVGGRWGVFWDVTASVWQGRVNDTRCPWQTLPLMRPGIRDPWAYWDFENDLLDTVDFSGAQTRQLTASVGTEAYTASGLFVAIGAAALDAHNSTSEMLLGETTETFTPRGSFSVGGWLYSREEQLDDSANTNIIGNLTDAPGQILTDPTSVEGCFSVILSANGKISLAVIGSGIDAFSGLQSDQILTFLTAASGVTFFDQQHHFVFTYDVNVGTDTAKGRCYIDGVEVVLQTTGGGDSLGLDAANNGYVDSFQPGGELTAMNDTWPNGDGSMQRLRGAVDGLFLYEDAIHASDVWEIYNATTAPTPHAKPDIVKPIYEGQFLVYGRQSGPRTTQMQVESQGADWPGSGTFVAHIGTRIAGDGVGRYPLAIVPPGDEDGVRIALVRAPDDATGIGAPTILSGSATIDDSNWSCTAGGYVLLTDITSDVVLDFDVTSFMTAPDVTVVEVTSNDYLEGVIDIKGTYTLEMDSETLNPEGTSNIRYVGTGGDGQEYWIYWSTIGTSGSPTWKFQNITGAPPWSPGGGEVDDNVSFDFCNVVNVSGGNTWGLVDVTP